MRILHYILGFPPMRSGGLTWYAVVLMHAEKELGHDVCAVYPGNFSFFFKKRKVAKVSPIGGIHTYTIKNALPLPLLHGIKKPKLFVCNQDRDFEIFFAFFAKNKFDVLHIHTMMGMPIAFLKAAKQNNVKIVYTTHDYFGLCPRVNFIDNSGKVCVEASTEHCALCNANAKPLWYIWLRNSWVLLLAKKLLNR